MNESFVDVIIKNFFKAAFATAILGTFIYIMYPFLVFIMLGGILAMALAPFVDFFIRRGLSRNLSLALFSSLLFLVGVLPTMGFFIRGTKVMTEYFQNSNINEFDDKFTKSIYALIHKVSELYGVNEGIIRSKFDAFAASAVTILSSIFGELVYQLPEVIMGGLITILSLYCFLKESHRIRFLFDRYSYLRTNNTDRFILMIKSCCREVFFANIITGVIQATIVSLGAMAFGIGDFYLVFFITFIVSFIPIIGAAPVAAVLAVLCFMDSRTGAGFGMLGVAAFSGLSDNIARPLLGSLGSVEVHPFIGLLSVIGGVIMFGLPGLFLGPLVTSLIFGALPIIIDEYFPLNKNTPNTTIVEVDTMIVDGPVVPKKTTDSSVDISH